MKFWLANLHWMVSARGPIIFRNKIEKIVYNMGVSLFDYFPYKLNVTSYKIISNLFFSITYITYYGTGGTLCLTLTQWLSSQCRFRGLPRSEEYYWNRLGCNVNLKASWLMALCCLLIYIIVYLFYRAVSSPGYHDWWRHQNRQLALTEPGFSSVKVCLYQSVIYGTLPIRDAILLSHFQSSLPAVAQFNLTPLLLNIFFFNFKKYIVDCLQTNK